MRTVFLSIALLASCLISAGQTVDEYLAKVASGNREIVSYGRLLEARKLEARTGITPPDPFISSGYMPGKLPGGGVKRTFGIMQTFSFPAKYLMQKKVNNSSVALAEQEYMLGKTGILVEAKITAYGMIYSTKMLNRLQLRKQEYERLASAWKKMLENGETTIMDYNRVMIGISEMNLDIATREADSAMLAEKLRFLAGSDDLPILPAEYPVMPLPDREQTLREKSSIHPSWTIPVLEYNISAQEVRVARAVALPEFEIGYQSEILPGENYGGPAGGLSIPLWANAGKVKAASARADHTASVKDAELARLDSEFNNEFARLAALKEGISQVRSILGSGGSKSYLDKALTSGEISLITYFSYLENLYESEDRLMELEFEYIRSLAALLDHEVLKAGF